jgi:ABC-type nitrate/sulfonate/bicarbonate transport system substrate-binding protein
MSKNFMVSIKFVLSIVSILVALNVSARAQEKTIVFGATVSLEGILPVLVAWQKGYFKKRNLGFKFVRLGGAKTRDALAAGQVNFGMLHTAPVWTAVQKKLPIRFISMYYNKGIFGVLVSEKLKATVKNIGDLKGLKGLSFVPGSASFAVSAFYLNRNGLNIQKDVKMAFVSSGDPKVWLNAIETGKVDFLTGVWEPTFSTAVRRGKSYSLLDPSHPKVQKEAFGGDISTLGVVTNLKVIKDDPKLVKDMIAAVDEGLTFIHGSSIDELVKLTLDTKLVNLKPEFLASLLSKMRGNFEKTGRPSVSKYNRAVDAYLKGGFLKKRIPFGDVVATSIAGSSK